MTPGTNLGQVFLNEFVCVSTQYVACVSSIGLTRHPARSQDFMIGLVIWAVDDPTNFTVSPLAAPWLIAFV